MRSSKKVVLLLVVLLVSICLLAGGCTSSKKPLTSPENTRRPNATTTTNDQALAKKSAAEASKVQGVNKATAVVANRTIYIGLDLKSNAGKAQVANIQRMVASRVQPLQPNYKVMVTADMDTVTRIKGVSQGVSQGKPISSFTNEIKNINSRMTPKKTKSY